MPSLFDRLRSFLSELKRRNVYRVAATYAVVAFVGFQAAKLLIPSTVLPPWTDEFFLFLLIIGFPVALVVAWAIELTPEGMRRTTEARGAGEEPSPGGIRTGYRVLVGVGLVAAAVAGGWYLSGVGGDDDPARTDRLLAVLPFENLSPDPDDAYFAAGVHEEILTQLSKVGGIKLISRTSVLRYEDTGKSLPEIAEELGVSTILEGSVQRVGDEVRIAVQLNDARADEHLWAESYDRRLSDIFRIQADVATRVVEELRGVLTPEERAELARRPTDDMEAYAHYLRGHQHFWKLFSEQETRAAAEAYERAAELDPGFAAAWSRLVQARTWLAWIWGEYDERTRARTALRRLERVAPGSPELRLARGIWLYYGVQRYEEALREFEVLADLWPGDIDVMVYRGALYRRLGRWEEAVRTWERVLELDPANASIAFTLGEAYRAMRRFEQAERYFKRAVALDPTVPVHWWGLVFTRVTRGDMTAARATVDTARRRLDEEDWENGGWWALWQVYTGGMDEVLELYRELYREATFIDGTWHLSWDLGVAAAAASGRSEIVQAYADTLRVQAEKALTAVPAEYVNVRGLALSQLALAHAYLGNEETAVRTARQAVGLVPVSRDAAWGGHRVLTEAHVYTVVGRHDQAVDRLRYLLSIPAGGVSVPLLRMDLRWDPLRDHPGFQELIQEEDASGT